MNNKSNNNLIFNLIIFHCLVPLNHVRDEQTFKMRNKTK